MPKSHIHFSDLKKYDTSFIKSNGWTLVAGAGISTPAFPTWHNLTRRLTEDISESNTSIFDHLQSRFSLDTIIEAALNQILQQDPNDPEQYREFHAHISSALYRDLQQAAMPGSDPHDVPSEEYNNILQFLEADKLGGLSPRIWKPAYEFIKSKFPTCTSLHLACAICDAHEKGNDPRAIVSFNAEPLLPACINAEHAVRRSSLDQSPTTLVSRIMGSISSSSPATIPCYFCHGYLSPPDGDWRSILDVASSKLVFSESEYGRVANSAWSWQSSIFSSLANESSMIFTGLSMSDPNIRRWLSWIHQNRMEELNMVAEDAVHQSFRHWWIDKTPPSLSHRDWIQSCVSGLGVRVLWVDEWHEVGDALSKLLIF